MRNIALAFILLSQTAAFAAENWPEYRGPTGQGVSDASGLPLTWGESQNIKWKAAIPGSGWSSPVVWGDQIWLTTGNESGTERSAICVDRETGKLLHQVKLFDVASVIPQHDLNSHASPSPVIEQGRVYLHFGTYGTACIDTLTGKPLWRRADLNLDHQVGPGSSPVLVGDLLVFHCDGTDVQYIVALNKLTGETVWKTKRSADFSALIVNMHKASSTPLPVEVDGKTQLLSIGAHCLYGYDALTGRELWRSRFSGYSNVARPVSDGKVVIFSTGYETPELRAVRLGGSGDVTDSHADWSYPRNVPAMPSPLLVDGLVYTTNDSGIATCVDADTGEMVWRERIGGQYSASPLYAEGRIYFFSQEGKAIVIAAERQFKKLAESTLDEGFMASPAVAGKAFYLRTKTHLYRVEQP